jgi:hypothetical protein
VRGGSRTWSLAAAGGERDGGGGGNELCFVLITSAVTYQAMCPFMGRSHFNAMR